MLASHRTRCSRRTHRQHQALNAVQQGVKAGRRGQVSTPDVEASRRSQVLTPGPEKLSTGPVPDKAPAPGGTGDRLPMLDPREFPIADADAHEGERAPARTNSRAPVSLSHDELGMQGSGRLHRFQNVDHVTG